MKISKISFLFFYLLLSSFFGNNVYSQKQSDSLWHYYNLLINTKESKDYILSYNFYEKHKNISLESKDTLSAIQDLRYMSFIQSELGQLYESEATAIEALQLTNSIDAIENVIEAKVGIYNHLGIIAYESKNYDRAIEYYDKTLELENNLSEITTILNNKANVYKEQKKYNLALQEFSKVYENSILLNDSIQTARALSNLGFTQSKLNYSDALSNILEALEIRKNKNHISGIYSSYLYLSEYYKDRGLKEKALFYANEALKLSISMNNASNRVNALSYIVELDDNPNIMEYKRLTDSISLAKQLNENKFASIKYDYAEEKRKADEAKLDLVQSELQKEKENRAKLIYFFLFIIAIITGITITISQRTKHKKNIVIKVYQTEAYIAKKVHDELANDMSDLMNFVENDIAIPKTKKSLLLDNIQDIYKRTRDISTETGSIDLDNFSESIKYLLMQHNHQDTKVIINNINTIDWKNVEGYKKIVVYRSLQELMVNMKKHSKAKVVSVIFKEHNNKKEIRYVDDGVGFANNEVKLNGLLNVESRINGIGGSFNFTTSKGNGFKATLEFNS